MRYLFIQLIHSNDAFFGMKEHSYYGYLKNTLPLPAIWSLGQPESAAEPRLSRLFFYSPLIHPAPSFHDHLLSTLASHRKPPRNERQMTFNTTTFAFHQVQ